MKVELEDGKLRGMCRSSCHLLLAEMTNYPSTPETPVGATALAIVGETWQNLANLGESWQILLEKTAWHLRSRG